ncbi:MAG: response regulator FixJ [Acetobacteraceae bacterium]
MDEPATVHVVDDDAAVRDSLRVLLEAAGFTVRTHASAGALLAAEPEPLGCVLTDVRMPEIDGLELQRLLNASGIGLPVIVMTGHGGVPVAVSAMKEGAVDFLEKPFDDEQLLRAIRRAVEQSRQHQARELAAAEAAARLAQLTRREREVLDRLVGGLSTKAIAKALGASPRTIEVHRARVFEKLKAGNLPDLVRLVLAADPAGARRPDS